MSIFVRFFDEIYIFRTTKKIETVDKDAAWGSP